MSDKNMSVVRVEKLSAGSASKSERHNERKNESYGNVNVEEERIPYNVHYKSPGDLTYNEYFDRLVETEAISTRGQKDGATHFNELVFDVNTRYFEEHGGYEYAKSFYAEAYRFCCQVYGEQNIVSAVMHADEINKAVSDETGKPVYHYHLHVVAIPTVRKEIRWSKRCKDEALRGTVKEVIQQVSHSKKWKNTVPILDEQGQQMVNKYGKAMFRKSYSVLQDEFFEHMKRAGFKDFERGELGSTAEHLSSLEYQIEQDKGRLSEVKQEVKEAKANLAEVKSEVKVRQKISATYSEIDALGSKTMTGKYTVSKEELDSLKVLAKEGVSSRAEIHDLQQSLGNAQRRMIDLSSRLSNMTERFKELSEKYDRLVEVTRPYLMALQRFPERVKEFFEKLFPTKERAEEKDFTTPQRKPKSRDDGAR